MATPVVPAEPTSPSSGAGHNAALKLMQVVRPNQEAEIWERAEEHSEEDLGVVAELRVPLEWTWVLLQRFKIQNYFFRLVAYVIFTALFTAIFQMLRPVESTFAVQDTILEHTARELAPGAPWARSFYDISTDAEWFEWVETALLPSILGDAYFNGDLRNQTWGNRFVNTVSMYNTQTAPVRFRQARVTDDSCGSFGADSALGRPCWGEFTSDRQFKQAFGEDYDNQYLTGLSGISGLSSFGTEAHVVDVDLNKATALGVVRKMKEGLWLNEQTRMVSIETSWYNANLDLSTYCRWQLDISAGGRFKPSVVIHSCRLRLYSSTWDKVRMVFELLWLWMFIYLIAEQLQALVVAKKAYFTSVWNLLEVVNLGMYILLIICWALYLAKDTAPFEVVSTAKYGSRPDLSDLTGRFDFVANVAAYNIVFSYVKVFKYMQIYPQIGLLWRTLKQAANDTWPFLFVFLLFTCGFSFAGHWMFGLMMVEFHTWPQTFVTLFLTMVGGYPYDEMKQVAPVTGPLFTIAWVLIMVMVIANMFVAILAEWYRRVIDDHKTEETKVWQKAGAGLRSRMGAGDLLRSLFLMCPGVGGAPDNSFRAQEADVRRMLQRGDFRSTDYIRRALISNEELVTEDLAHHFGGDIKTTADFVRRVQQIEQSEVARSHVGFDDAEEEEVQEQEQLRKLRTTVDRLEGHVRELRGALHRSGVAPLRPGQAEAGYLVGAAEPVGEERPMAEPAASGVGTPLPGAVPEE
mmetsp:Transcript_41450/g.93503  ORF Transcript_41450/g.93503 Transcript_41450/m.93503 type:complete len:746 (-) Transcript_41450:9-2246(-)